MFKCAILDGRHVAVSVDDNDHVLAVSPPCDSKFQAMKVRDAAINGGVTVPDGWTVTLVDKHAAKPRQAPAPVKASSQEPIEKPAEPVKPEAESPVAKTEGAPPKKVPAAKAPRKARAKAPKPA